jgi:hypothetical protein
VKRLPKIVVSEEVDPATLGYWNELSKSHAFHRVLNFCESNHKKEYAESFRESQFPHVQLERLGAMKGWNRLLFLLLNPPDPLDSEEIPKKSKHNTTEYTE